MGGGASAVGGNLPAELTSFIGRRRLLQDVKSGLSSCRLLTLVGPGGVGKTRLALRAAAELERAVAGGAWLVELAGLDEAELVPKTVMTAVGLHDQSGGWTTSLLVDYLRDRRALLVFDNCEHLLDACAVLADALLREASELRILATSRQPLGVAGERVLRVTPLGLPECEGAGSSSEQVAQSEAVLLFAERAAQATGDFAIDDDNRAAVVELVSRLDGMPLAIELAAGRLRTLGVGQILERLDDRFRLLSTGARTAPRRQQSLRAAIDWSYDLLDTHERDVLHRLSLFAGSFSLDAAEAVCSSGSTARAAVVDLLSSLVERSFVGRLGTSTEARYRLHETMREYALARLRESGEERAAQQAFIEYYGDASRRFASEWSSPRLPEWLGWIDQEAGNVRAALALCLAVPADRERGLALVGRLGWYWTGHALTEGVHWLELFLHTDGGDDGLVARALFARGWLAAYQADADTAMRCATECEERARRVDDPRLTAWSLTLRSFAERLGGDFADARRHADEAASLAEAHADVASTVAARMAAGVAVLNSGDAAGARDLLLGAVDLARATGNLSLLSLGLQGAGYSCLALGLIDDASDHLAQAVRLARQLDDPAGLLFRLQAMAGLAATAGDMPRAARLIGVTARLQQEVGGRALPLSRVWIDRAEAMARGQLGDARFLSMRAEGENLDRAAAIAFALDERPTPSPSRPAGRPAGVLGRREREVAELVAEGLSNKAIAARLFLSERTVETHVYNILNKLGFSSRVQIAGWVAAQ